MDDIAKLKANDNAIYQEAVEMLKAEAAEDDRSRSKHGTDRWAREPSRVAGAKLQAQVVEYAGILKSADNSDKVVRAKLKDCEKMLRLLGGDTVCASLTALGEGTRLMMRGVRRGVCRNLCRIVRGRLWRQRWGRRLRS